MPLRPPPAAQASRLGIALAGCDRALGSQSRGTQRIGAHLRDELLKLVQQDPCPLTLGERDKRADKQFEARQALETVLGTEQPEEPLRER